MLWLTNAVFNAMIKTTVVKTIVAKKEFLMDNGYQAIKSRVEHLPIMTLVDEFNTGEIVIPPFQREKDVWAPVKKRAWCKWINNNTGHNVAIILYWLSDQRNNRWVSDGLQRLATTSIFLERPATFVKGTKKEDLEKHLRRFMVPVISAVYYSHVEAMKDFQRANLGTSLNPQEFFKGIMTADKEAHGQYIYDEVLNLVLIAINPWVKKRSTNSSRAQKSSMIRGALAMFLQYDTGFAGKSMWSAASSRVDLMRVEHSLESLIMNHIKDKQMEEIEKMINEFSIYINKMAKYIGNEAQKLVPGSTISPALLRHLLHAAIYCRNTAQIKWFKKYVNAFFQYQTPEATEKGYFSAQLLFGGKDKLRKSVAMSSDKLQQISAATRYLGMSSMA